MFSSGFFFVMHYSSYSFGSARRFRGMTEFRFFSVLVDCVFVGFVFFFVMHYSCWILVVDAGNGYFDCNFGGVRRFCGGYADCGYLIVTSAGYDDYAAVTRVVVLVVLRLVLSWFLVLLCRIAQLNCHGLLCFC